MIKESVAYILLSLVIFLALYGLLEGFKETPDSTFNRADSARVEEIPAYELPVITIPDEVYFAGERVPIEDPDVKERLDRELHVNTFWHSNTIFLLKRGNRWLPQIEEILVKNGVPEDFKYLPVIESDLTNAISPANAVGFWQLLKGTAGDYGLEVNNQVDERYDPLKATEAASKYLNKSYERLGSWTNAAGSYNRGMRGMERNLEDQKVDSYYDLLLNEETARYVLRAVAVKLIFENPKKFGFNLKSENLYHQEDLKEVKVEETIPNLRDFAFEQGINYKILKRHNPWLRSDRLTVRRGEVYTILIPKKRS